MPNTTKNTKIIAMLIPSIVSFIFNAISKAYNKWYKYLFIFYIETKTI